jgi:hypothetical protein
MVNRLTITATGYVITVPDINRVVRADQHFRKAVKYALYSRLIGWPGFGWRNGRL